MTTTTSTIKLEIVTRERLLVEDTVDEVQVRGKDGYLGVLPGHAPLITELGTGVMSYKKGNTEYFLAIINGFAEVLPEQVTVLAEVAELAEEVDPERAKAARERAEQRLSKSGNTDIDWDRASSALQRALVRLQVAAKGGAAAAEDDRHHLSS